MLSNPDISTENLFLMLENETDISENWETLSEQMKNPTFHEYLHKLISDKNITVPELSHKALLSRSFTYQIFSGSRVPCKDIIIRIVLAAGIPLEDTQRLLKLADRGILYPKVQRDAAIIYAITNKYDLYKADEFLSSLGQKPLL